jgi:hypothetical protein
MNIKFLTIQYFTNLSVSLVARIINNIPSFAQVSNETCTPLPEEQFTN